ncbi:hypothetical protein GCM10010123_05520 [Pilimelia anulata]|uniref:Peptidase M4 C-terminal domain-containing protein n=1 Tax=Pilimelia anulata TaxID=53371 RepID=A0A8J3B716_9ACTN|nr:M4 family metallopeptidase [Pilimelia anulata]GGJ78429.1 hypothetical protein GCM10010123_05520 [Pilimelia anulata]
MYRSRLAAAALAAPLLLAAAPAAAAPPSTTTPAATRAALNRAVCDGANQRYSNHFCGQGVKVTRTEGSGPSGVKDVDAAYDFLGDLDRFYASVGGDFQQMLASDIGGKPTVGVSVRVCDSSGECPGGAWPTYYTGKHVVLNSGLFSDDTFAHEFTHGVQDHHGKLGDKTEALAVSEGIADILGELVDLTNGSADDTAAVRWKMGDGSPYGIYRDMDKPGLRKMPDRKGGQYWASDGNAVINAAVVEKAGFLIAEGETFNGQTVTGIGTAKSAALWYGVIKAMPARAQFKQLASTVRSVCAAHARDGVAGTTTADCGQVDKAVKATQLES